MHVITNIVITNIFEYDNITMPFKRDKDKGEKTEKNPRTSGFRASNQSTFLRPNKVQINLTAQKTKQKNYKKNPPPKRKKEEKKTTTKPYRPASKQQPTH